MSHDTPLVVLAGVAAAVAAILAVDSFPKELPSWLAFLVLTLGATLLLGQVLGRIADEWAPPRGEDRYGREREWSTLFTALGASLGLVIFLGVALVVILF